MGIKEYLGGTPFHDERDVFRANSVKHLLEHKLQKRDWQDRMWFDRSWVGLNGFCAFSAMTIHTLFRRQLYVYEGLISGYFGLTGGTCILNMFLQWGFVQKPLLKGDVQCGLCALGRGAGVQVATGYLLPGMVSFALNAWVADRYKSTYIPRFDLPMTAEFKTYWAKHLKVIFRKTRPVLALQVLAGTVVAYKEFNVVHELRNEITEEEYNAIWTNIGVK